MNVVSEHYKWKENKKQQLKIAPRWIPPPFLNYMSPVVLTHNIQDYLHKITDDNPVSLCRVGISLHSCFDVALPVFFLLSSSSSSGFETIFWRGWVLPLLHCIPSTVASRMKHHRVICCQIFRAPEARQVFSALHSVLPSNNVCS